MPKDLMKSYIFKYNPLNTTLYAPTGLFILVNVSVLISTYIRTFTIHEKKKLSPLQFRHILGIKGTYCLMAIKWGQTIHQSIKYCEAVPLTYIVGVVRQVAGAV